MLVTAYLPLLPPSPGRLNGATFLMRTSSFNSLAMAPTLRREVSRARPDLRVSDVRTQLEINQAQTVRERLLAMLGAFFAGVAVLLAGIGLYGVLEYSVLQRQRELGIRITIGASSLDIARGVTATVFAMVLLGAFLGECAAIYLQPYVKSLLYGVKSSDWRVVAVPLLTILGATLLVSIPAVVRAIRIDPAAMLRAD